MRVNTSTHTPDLSSQKGCVCEDTASSGVARLQKQQCQTDPYRPKSTTKTPQVAPLPVDHPVGRRSLSLMMSRSPHPSRSPAASVHLFRAAGLTHTLPNYPCHCFLPIYCHCLYLLLFAAYQFPSGHNENSTQPNLTTATANKL